MLLSAKTPVIKANNHAVKYEIYETVEQKSKNLKNCYVMLLSSLAGA